MKLAVIGIGAMGEPIAKALAAMHDVSAFDIDRDRMATIATHGIAPVASIASLASAADILITVLPGAHETESVVLEALPHLSPRTTWLDLSTGDPRVTRRLADGLKHRRVGSVTATMAGGPTSARDRDLHFTVAGEPESVRHVMPVLGVMTNEVVDVIGDDPAHAQTVKLLSNLLWFGQVVAVTEAMLLGRAMGIQPAALRGLLAERSGSSVLLSRDYGAVLRGEYMATFGIDRIVEQLATVSSLAAAKSVPFELSALVERTHRDALDTFGPVAGELLAARLLEERNRNPLGRS